MTRRRVLYLPLESLVAEEGEETKHRRLHQARHLHAPVHAQCDFQVPTQQSLGKEESIREGLVPR
jgi:hypothetical protein